MTDDPAIRVGRGPADFAGLSLARPLVMGIVNVTPDSFSDGGDFATTEAALAQGLRLMDEGADILDVGGESTRPGAEPVAEEAELARVLPVIRGLAEAGAVVSVDTRHPAVMEQAVAAGAAIINDVTALAGDGRSLAVAAAAGVPVVLMHMQGEPGTMQADPHYDDVVAEVTAFLADRAEACLRAGIPGERIAVDPGIGFGKTVEHNLELLAHLDDIGELGFPILLGVSRKRFIGSLSGEEAPKARVPGSLAAALAGVERGANILRVHDVAATRQALAVWTAIEDIEARDFGS